MEFQQQLHLVLSCLRNGRMTSRDIANSTAIEQDRISSRLVSYKQYGYIFKKRNNKNKKRFIWALTEKGKKKLEFLDLKFAPDKTAMINLTEAPYNHYKKVIIKNGNENIELIPQNKNTRGKIKID